MYSRFNIQGAWGGVSCAALYCVRVAQAERTDTECCNRASIVQATESACTVRILHGILTESALQVRPSPGSVAPASFINTVDRVNPSTWSHFPVCMHFSWGIGGYAESS